MDFSFSDDQHELRELTAKILADTCTAEYLRAVSQTESGTDLDLWRTLAEAGIVSIGWPGSAGGGGLGWMGTAIVLEETGRFAAPVPAFPVMALAGPALAAAHGATRSGDAQAGDQTIGALLRDMAAGAAIVTAAIHEPNGDPFAPSLTADGGTLTGTKICVPHGTEASHAVVTTSDGLWLVALSDDTGAPTTVTIERQDTTSGVPDARITFDTTPAIRLGGPTERDALMWRGVSGAALLTSGMCAASLQLTADYTKGREQFGKPIASFQAVSQRAADGYIDTEAVRLTAWQAAWRLDDALGAGGAGSVGSLDDGVVETLLTAKFWSAEGGWRVIHAAHHLHGGFGVDRDYPLHRYLLLMKQLELQLGSANPTLAHLGRRLAER